MWVSCAAHLAGGGFALSTLLGDAEDFPQMPLLFSPTQCGLSDLKAAEVCQKQAEAVTEKPATSRLFNAHKNHKPNLSNSCWIIE
ncbi:Secreted protein [Pseudomonas marginalis]|jgi:hypothetical protein|nr:hypothetical protein FIV40_23770 [Pseudomonas marginalis]